MNREQVITKVGFIGILTNVLLVIFKMLVGFWANSIAIILDAVNNLTDVVSSLIAIIGIKIAKKQPDNDHPFGHGRAEYFSAMAISLIIFATGAYSLFEVFKKVIYSEKIPNYSFITTIIILISVITKVCLAIYCKKQGKKFNSHALMGSGADALNDALISVSLLAGIFVFKLFNFSIDNYLGIIISFIIIKSGLEILMGIIGEIMGSKPDSAITSEIKKTINAQENVMGTYDLVVHNYGPEFAMGSVHIEIPAEMKAENVHILTNKIQRIIAEKFHVIMTIGIYAVNTKDENKIRMRYKIKDIVENFDGVMNCHGIYINNDEKYISLDAVLNFSIKEKDIFREKITNTIKGEFPEYKINTKFDLNYSD